MVADRGYYKGEQILECDNGRHASGTQSAHLERLADGRFDKQDFIYIAQDDQYRCPAGEIAVKRFTTVEHGMEIDVYWTSACPRCAMKPQCTTSEYRRIRRWKHEAVLDAMQERLDRRPEICAYDDETAEHPFGTIKLWMGSTHFLMKTLAHVRTEMSLHVLAYNLKRLINMLGVEGALAAIRA